jgi:large subunit ribosomal protein L19
MSSIIDGIEQKQLRKRPAFQAGDRLRVHFQVVEGSRRRTQVFDGVVIKLQGSGARETFTVRKQSFGVGVERTFPLHSPKIEKIEVASRGDVRRAKLYYLRDRVGRRARVRERVFTGAEQAEYSEMADAQGLQEEAPPVPAPDVPEGAEEEAEATEAGSAEAADTSGDQGTADEQQAEAAADEGEAPSEGEPEPEGAGEEGETEAQAEEPDAGAADDGADPDSPDEAEQE